MSVKVNTSKRRNVELTRWNFWNRLKTWHAGRTAEEAPVSHLDMFLRLRPWQRVLCIVGCASVYTLAVQSTFSANVAPHFVGIVDRDGHFNVHEFVETLKLSASVVLLTLSTILFAQARSATAKIGVAAMSVFIFYTTLNNACFMQKQAREVRNDAPRQKADRIARLEAEIKNGETAYKQVPAHDYVLASTVKSAEAVLEGLRKSATEECGTDIMKMKLSRGPKCEGLEKKRDAKAEEVEKLQHNADLTQRATDIEVALDQLRRDRKAEGATPETTGTEMEPIPALMAAVGFISVEKAQALTEFKPSTDAITMELMAIFGAPAGILLVFNLFGLLVCTKGEAQNRMIKALEVVTTEHAGTVVAPVGITLTSVPSAPENDDAAELEADDNSPAAVLEIEEKLPAFVENPKTELEAVSAALIKADRKRSPRKARTRKAPSPDSVLLWFKERAFKRDNRDTASCDAIVNYKTWCEDNGLEPVNGTIFGKTLKNELKIEKRKNSGRVKYLNMGLVPAPLRVVA
jgi:hypothetical protein